MKCYIFVEKELLVWMRAEERTPLIIRGARQVGKSYTVEEISSNWDSYIG